MKRNPLIPFALIAIIGLVLAVVISYWGAHIVNQQQAAKKGGQTQQAAEQPQKIFAQNCAACHGQNLQGGAGPNLQHIGSQLSKARILHQIKNGGGGMPANVIQGAQAEKVAEWLSKKK